MIRRSLRTLPAIGLLALVSAVIAPAAGAADASGELCGDDSGVSVVVDFGELEDRVEQACVTDGGEVAGEVFESAGFDLTPVGSFPGAVCQIEEQPADVPCQAMPPADAYWGLYVVAADGDDAGEWGFAPVGADELEVTDGDLVGFAWQSDDEPAEPAVDPAAAGTGAGASAADEEPSATPDETAGGDEQVEPGPEVGGEDSGLVDGEGGMAWWVPAIGLLALGGVAFAISRARRGAAGRDER